MKGTYRVTISSRKKAKRRKKTTKSLATAVIAQQYMELLRLRKLVSEAELWRAVR